MTTSYSSFIPVPTTASISIHKHPYVYCRNNPVNYRDPTGQQEEIIDVIVDFLKSKLKLPTFIGTAAEVELTALQTAQTKLRLVAGELRDKGCCSEDVDEFSLWLTKLCRAYYEDYEPLYTWALPPLTEPERIPIKEDYLGSIQEPGPVYGLKATLRATNQTIDVANEACEFRGISWDLLNVNVTISDLPQPPFRPRRRR